MARDCIEQIDMTVRLVENYPEVFELVREPEDVARVYAQGKIASSIGIEGYEQRHYSRATLTYRLDCIWLETR
jgi:microsomal dipeptidase-like Zn-dependent dipeptidase